MIFLAASILVQGPGLPNGEQILTRCQKAYDSVQTFEENVTGTTRGVKVGGAEAGSGHATAEIIFKRPGKLRVSGKTLFSTDYEALCANGQAWVKNNGAWSKQADANLAIATITGISANAGTTVPAMLLHTFFGSLALPRGTAMGVRMEIVGGVRTFVVSSDTPMPTTRWIDARTYFLVRTESTIMGVTLRVDFGPPKVNQPVPDRVFQR